MPLPAPINRQLAVLKQVPGVTSDMPFREPFSPRPDGHPMAECRTPQVIAIVHPSFVSKKFSIVPVGL